MKHLIMTLLVEKVKNSRDFPGHEDLYSEGNLLAFTFIVTNCQMKRVSPCVASSVFVLFISLHIIVHQNDPKCFPFFFSAAKYRPPVIISNPKEITQTSGGTLMCHTFGGYPRGSIHWYGEFGSDWTKSAVMKAEETEDGLFQLSSELPLNPGSTFSKYTCVVQNASGSKEAESTIDIKPTPSGTIYNVEQHNF